MLWPGTGDQPCTWKDAWLGWPALLLLAPLLGALLGGCPGSGGPTSAPGPATGGPSSATAAPSAGTSAAITLPEDALREDLRPGVVLGRFGGELVLPTPVDPKTFNPVLANEQSTTAVLFPMVFTTLTRWDPITMQDEPELARSWERSPDGLTWTIHLRRGVRWSDGQPFTADDVAFNLAVTFDPKIPSPHADMFQDSQGRLPRWEQVDDHTIRFQLQEVNVLFLSALGSLYLAPRHRLAAAHQQGRFLQAWSVATPPEELAGLGPFRIKLFKPGQRLVLERNPHYWKVDAQGRRLPYLDRVYWLIVPDFNAALLRFQQGELDLYEEVQADQFDLLRRDEAQGRFKLWDLGPSLAANYFGFNWSPKLGADGRPVVDPVRRAWYADARFRRAISHAIDREGIVQTALLGRGRPLYCFDSESNRRWASPCPRFPFDPARAAALLDELGLKDTDGDGIRDDGRGHPVRFPVITNAENRERVAVATVIQDNLARVGIKMDLRPLPFNSLVTAMRETHAWEALIGGWGSAVPPDPVLSKNIFLSSGQLHLWHPGQAQPATPWEARIDELVGQLTSQPELSLRQQAYRELTTILAEQQAQIYTYNTNQYIAARVGLGNLRPTVFRPYSYWNVHLLFRER